MKNSLVNWAKRLLVTYHAELERAVDGSRSLLDIGCGSDSPVHYFHHRPAKLVGVDGFAESIEISRSKGIHDEYFSVDLTEIDTLFQNASFDCVLASDVIEHFPKDVGFSLIRKMEKIASKTVIIFTPNGFLPQDEHGGNKLQRHQSGWDVDEFRGMGYEVIGINGWKPLLGEFGLPRWWPGLFWRIVSRITQPLVRSHPHHAFQLLCVKRMQY